MINLKRLRIPLENYIMQEEGTYLRGKLSKRINIKRKKKMIIEKNSNGDMKLKRRNVIKIEIIE